MISIIIPVFNEEDNLTLLLPRIASALTPSDYEIIAVDDGSTDDSYNRLKELANHQLRIIHYDGNRGQSYAVYTGITKAKGELIGLIDADQQNDPRDFICMMGEMQDGTGLVCGWRHERKDSITKRIYSWIGNRVLNFLLGMSLHDSNCSIKVFRKSCLDGIRYFNGMHRVIPALIYMQGFRVKEVKVRHYPRFSGKSKYGISNRLFGNVRLAYDLKFHPGKFLPEKIEDHLI